MTVLVSVGIRAYDTDKRHRLLDSMRKHLPDPTIYDSHEYTGCFRLDGEPIIMSKRRNGDVELSLTCDSSGVLFPI